MQVRILVYLLLLSVLVGVLAYFVVVYFPPTSSSGRGYGGGQERFVWIPIAVAPITFAVGLLAYVALFPAIKSSANSQQVTTTELQMNAITKVLKEDERKVVELLIASGGKMLQRDIARQTGFSRVKTHRILYRLASRGIVTAEKHYNTYEITLSDWLHPKH